MRRFPAFRRWFPPPAPARDGVGVRRRMTEQLCLVGLAVAAASLPFDVVAAPAFVSGEDVVAAAIFGALVLLNRRGHHLAARVSLLGFSNAVIFASAALLGRESGQALVFFVLALAPFVLFEERERRFMALLAGLSIASFFVLELGGYAWFARWKMPAASTYRAYSAVVAFAVLAYMMAALVREQARMQRALVASEERQRLVTELAADAILTVSDDRQIASASPAAERLFGLAPDALAGRRLDALVDEPAALAQAFETGFAEVRCTPPGGPTREVELTVGEPTALWPWRTVVARDVSERQAIRRALELARAQSVAAAKMAALGEMSSGIAHEVNNPLTVLGLLATRLRRVAEAGELDPKTAVELADRQQEIVRRIAGIVQGLRSFARDAAGDPFVERPVAAVVEETLGFCRERFRQHGITLEVLPMAGLTVECRPVQLSQILLNLLNNAHDAVLGREERWVRIAAEAHGDDVELAVVDSGPGIAPGLRERILLPFFTTKPVGEGTGLGLAVASGLAQAHHGRLWLDTASASTRFVLRLPTRQPVDPAATATAAG